jgi:Astacin (Peptidase family M12A)
MPRICFDRILPKDLRTGPPPPPVPGQVARAAFDKRKLWPVGQILRVAFLSGTKAQQDIVKKFAPEWSKHGNIVFDFVNNTKPHIRINFDPNDGSWSYVGLDCKTIPAGQPTMNFGWQDEGVVLHEFGHAIGLIHEHENPNNAIKWNKEAVYRDLGGSPNFWDKATVDNNMFEVYSLSQVNATKVDKKSIMLYEIPESWTTNKFSSTANEVLSPQDKKFIGDQRNYPMKGARTQ